MADRAEPSSRVRTIAAGTIGNALEWYDFSIYGLFAVQIGAHFFRASDPVSHALAAFAVFAVGFLVRPIGGILFGHLGDRLGPATALVASIVTMTVPTVLIGVLPGYDTLGIAAPVLLTVLRMLQGVAGGGEAALASVFLVERAPHARRGLIGAIGGCGTGLGIKIAALVTGICAATMSGESLADWGWRIPFLLGLGLGVVGLMLRRNLRDQRRLTVGAAPSPLLEVLRHHRGAVLRLAGICAYNAVGFHVAFTFAVYWLQQADGLAPVRALQLNTLAMLAVSPVTLAAGWLSDRIGRRKLLFAATTIGLLGAQPFFMLMHHQSAGLILAGQLGFVISLGLGFGVTPAMMVEISPAPVRCTAIALGSGLSFSIIGGLVPLTATWLMHRTGDALSPAWLVMAAALVTCLTVLAQNETFRQELGTAASEPARA